MLILKNLPLSDVELKLDGDTGKFSGYASVFGGVDSYGDTIVAGAFDYTLRTHGKPKMFYGHDWSMPIGKWTSAKETDKGLFVEGELTPGLSRSIDVRAALKHGTLDGLSIGGMLKKGDYDETETGRVIRRWTKLVEVSPVVFPADGAARIDPASVKSIDFAELIDEVETIRDFERLLRDAGGFSKQAAVALVARAKQIFGAEGEPGREEKQQKLQADLLRRIEAMAAT